LIVPILQRHIELHNSKTSVIVYRFYITTSNEKKKPSDVRTYICMWFLLFRCCKWFWCFLFTCLSP